MSSDTAKAIYQTMVGGLEYLSDYFEYRDKTEFIDKINMKCLTS